MPHFSTGNVLRRRLRNTNGQQSSSSTDASTAERWCWPGRRTHTCYWCRRWQRRKSRLHVRNWN